MRRVVFECNSCRKEIREDEGIVKIMPVLVDRENEDIKGDVFPCQKEAHYCMECAERIMMVANGEVKEEKKDRKAIGKISLGKENDKKVKTAEGIKKLVLKLYKEGQTYERIKRDTGLSIERIESIIEELDPDEM